MSSSAQNVTEATTRTLHPPVEYAAPPTNMFSAQPTAPAYLAPQEMSSTPANTTPQLALSSQGKKFWVISLIAIVSLIALIGLGLMTYLNRTASVPTPPPVPISPPPPVPPPSVPVDSDSSTRSYIYPGAETLMNMSRADGSGIIQLRTKDSFEKVLEWYVAKLKPENTIKPSATNAVLKTDKAMAVINGDGTGTNVVLKLLGTENTEDYK